MEQGTPRAQEVGVPPPTCQQQQQQHQQQLQQQPQWQQQQQLGTCATAVEAMDCGIWDCGAALGSGSSGCDGDNDGSNDCAMPPDAGCALKPAQAHFASPVVHAADGVGATCESRAAPPAAAAAGAAAGAAHAALLAGVHLAADSYSNQSTNVRMLSRVGPADKAAAAAGQQQLRAQQQQGCHVGSSNSPNALNVSDGSDDRGKLPGPVAGAGAGGASGSPSGSGVVTANGSGCGDGAAPATAGGSSGIGGRPSKSPGVGSVAGNAGALDLSSGCDAADDRLHVPRRVGMGAEGGSSGDADAVAAEVADLHQPQAGGGRPSDAAAPLAAPAAHHYHHPHAHHHHHHTHHHHHRLADGPHPSRGGAAAVTTPLPLPPGAAAINVAAATAGHAAGAKRLHAQMSAAGEPGGSA
eukprot:44349-Chlamydomonas_euryale.AAC.1